MKTTTNKRMIIVLYLSYIIKNNILINFGLPFYIKGGSNSKNLETIKNLNFSSENCISAMGVHEHC